MNVLNVVGGRNSPGLLRTMTCVREEHLFYVCEYVCVCMWVYVCACSGYYAVINVASSSILGYVRLLVSSLLQWSDGFQILSQISSLTQFQHNHDLREGKGVNRTRECLGKRGREEGEV